jgi:hypothetical protein
LLGFLFLRLLGDFWHFVDDGLRLMVRLMLVVRLSAADREKFNWSVRLIHLLLIFEGTEDLLNFEFRPLAKIPVQRPSFEDGTQLFEILTDYEESARANMESGSIPKGLCS